MSGMRAATKKKYDEIYRLYLEGKSKREISEETYSSYSTIDRALREHGAALKKGNFKEREGEIMAMRQDGMTMQEIAEETGMDVKTIWSNLQGRDTKGSRADRKKRKDEVHRERAEKPEEEIIPRQYAEEQRQERELIVGGKRYIDITDWYVM